MDDDTATAGAPAAPDDDDSGFVSESQSVPFTTAPMDTTAGVEEASQASDIAEDAVEDETPAAPAGATREESASAATREATPVAGTTPAKKTLGQRIAALKKEVDTHTHAKHQTIRERDAAAAELASLRAQIESVKREAGAPPATDARQPAAQASVATAPAAMPKHPSYRDFATDEEYEAAVEKWHGDVAKFQEDRETALAAKIEAGLDTRLKSREDEDAARADESAFAERVSAVAATHPDFMEKAEALGTLRSSWYRPETHDRVGGDGQRNPIPTPFLSDLFRNHPDGPEMGYWLGSDLARAQVLADLLPNRPLRDAILLSPSIRPLLEHFATPEGVQEFDALKGMHPARVNQAIGALSVRLSTASRGSVAPVRPITGARPPARPPVGAPGAQGSTSSAAGPAPGQSFDAWMAEEDARERREKLKLAGVSA